MPRTLAAIQPLGFLVAGIAMSAPEFPRLFTDWSGGTIYPWWSALYIVVGLVASIGSLAVRDARWGPVAPTVLMVVAAQVAGLGFVAVRHWQPSFGIGGGYAGAPEELAQLAWVIGVAGTISALSALAQLVLWRAFPVSASLRGALLFGGIGAVIVLALPYAIGQGDPELRDLTSLGAFVLIYSGPIGGCVACVAWLSQRLRTVAIGSCAAAAFLSSLNLITDLSHSRGRPALAGTSLLLAALAVVAWWLPRSSRAVLTLGR